MVVRYAHMHGGEVCMHAWGLSAGACVGVRRALVHEAVRVRCACMHMGVHACIWVRCVRMHGGEVRVCVHAWG